MNEIRKTRRFVAFQASDELLEALWEFATKNEVTQVTRRRSRDLNLGGAARILVCRALGLPEPVNSPQKDFDERRGKK